jgi:hypothetical protein
MPEFFKPLSWSTNLIRGHSLGPSEPACALVSCTRSKSLWHRLRHRPNGAFLQGDFYCQPQCLEAALLSHLSRLRTIALSPQPPNRIPLGLLMVARGKLTHVEVRAALEAQRRARYGKIGDWIEKLGFATEQEVTSALALQWGCPVAAFFDPSAIQASGDIPLPILEAFQMLPLNYAAATNTLYLAFGERVDHAALYAIEKILACRTQPCVAGRKSIARQLDFMRQQPRPMDVEFGPMSDLAEMGRIAASYSSRLNPDTVRLGRVGSFIWLRLETRSNGRGNAGYKPRSKATNLVFRLAADSAPRLRREQKENAAFPAFNHAQPAILAVFSK